MRRAAAVGLALIAFSIPSSALAAPEDVANDISREVMSPFCDGVTLHDCPSQAATDLREQIARWAASRMNKPEIMERLEAEFGPGIRATPSRNGDGAPAWILPIVAVVGGLGLAFVLARRWSARRREDDGGGAAISMEERRRVDLELSAFRGER